MKKTQLFSKELKNFLRYKMNRNLIVSLKYQSGVQKISLVYDYVASAQFGK